jgi:transposase-like protein
VVFSGKGNPCIRCVLCGEIFPMHINLAIADELLRISEYLEPTAPCCPNLNCAGLEPSGGYHCTKYGVPRFGTPRYKCKTCKKVFAFGGVPEKGQHHTPHNRDIFCHLVNTVPLRRVMKLLGILASVLYARIDFIHRQCQLFAGDRERTLVDRKDLGKRYISPDRQTLLVNWSSKKARKAPATADDTPSSS